MEDQVQVELEIIQEELKRAGANVPLDVLAKWSIKARARIEQWAIRKRWATMKRPPCPKGHKITVPVTPSMVKKWLVN